MTLSIKFPVRSAFADRTADFIAAAVRWLAWPVRTFAARRVMQQLASLDDHELKDIGLYRQDLRDASGLPRDADPTRMLGRRVASRRRWV